MNKIQPVLNKIQPVCLSVRNRLPNHAYYVDEAFAGDSVGLGLGQRLNFVLKKLILRYFWGKIAHDEKILFTSRAGPALICFYVQQVLLKSKQRLIRAESLGWLQGCCNG